MFGHETTFNLVPILILIEMLILIEALFIGNPIVSS